MRLFLLLLSLWANTLKATPLLHLEQVLINGHFPEQDEYPEILQVFGEDNRGRWSCTATVIGAKVILTAAHCIGGPTGQLEVENVMAHCEQHPLYAAGNADADMALCRVGASLGIKPAKVAKEPIEVGKRVLLTGFGCTSSRREGAGELRIGESTVMASEGLIFETYGDAALCFGDSGGPVMVPDEEDENHIVAGVNSRGDIKAYSILTALWSGPAKSFMKDFAKRNRVRIR